MTSPYYLIVKKHLEEQRLGEILPDHIQRGWNHVYTDEEKQLNQHRCLMAPDGQIPNSIVRQRLATRETHLKTTMETFRKVFDLPAHLWKNLSKERTVRQTIDDENFRFSWTESDDDDRATKHRKSSIQIIVDKQREKRRRFEDQNYDYDAMEPLSLNEILDEIRTNVGKELTDEEIKLIGELMQIISRHKPDQVMRVYDLFTDVHLIDQIGGVPRLVQALQEIQKAFEQVTMKTNVGSIETVLELLQGNDQTYRVAMELFKSFNEMTKKYRRGKILKLIDQSGEISDHDQTVFTVLVKDRIQRLAQSDVSTLIDDLDAMLPMQKSRITVKKENLTSYLCEHLNLIFTRAHLNGIKTTFKTIGSPISIRLLEFIDRVEYGLEKKLTDQENLIVESYITDHLHPLNNQELKIVYERFAQQGILKRHMNTGDLHQTISMGLIKKIDTDGLTIVIDNINDSHLDFQPINELQKVLSSIDQYNHTDTPMSIEQIQNQLNTAYFIETLNIHNRVLYDLSKAIDFYSIAHLPLSEDMTIDDRASFLEHFKGPFVRLCLQRILDRISQDSKFDLKRVSSHFYHEQITQMFHELTNGSDALNQNLLLHELKTQLKKNKELPDKLYRQMVKDKLISPDQQTKIDNDKKKIALIIKESHVILNNDQDRQKQEQLVELLDKAELKVPEKVKTWYKSQLKTSKSPKSNLGGPPSNRQKTIPSKIKETKIKSNKLVQKTDNKTKQPAKYISKEVKSAVTREQNKINDRRMTHNSILEDNPNTASASSIVSIVIDQESSLDTQLMQESPKVIDENIRITTPLELSSVPAKEMLQASSEMIRAETVLEGIMESNHLIHLKSTQNAAVLLYLDATVTDLSQDMKSMIIANTAIKVEESSLEKTKAQRILTKSSTHITEDRSLEKIPIGPILSQTDVSNHQTETSSAAISTESSSEIPSIPAKSNENIKTTKRSSIKMVKEAETTYLSSLTTALRTLFQREEYNNAKLRKIHEELIISGHISPLNEFYRSINDALRVTLDHCLTYEDLIRWTLSLFRTHNKINLLQFARDLYGIAIELDLKLVQRVDFVRCSMELQENIKQQLQTLSEYDLREINSYVNATTWENLVHLSKKLHVTTKERMISDLHGFLLHLVQVCYTFDSNYRPFQLRLREIGENFKSRSVSDLVRKLDDIEKFLAQTFAITFIGLSQRMADARFVLIKEK